MNDKKENSIDDLMELVTKMYTDISGKLENNTKEINQMKVDISKIDKTVTNLENNLTDKVQILFENREGVVNTLEDIENKIDGLIEKTDKQDFEITLIKRKAK